MGIQAIGSTTAVDASSLAQSLLTNASTSAGKADKSEKTEKPGGAKPAGPPPSSGAAPAAAGSSSASSSAKIYDKRDANQDGTVSYQEELLYTIQHPTEEAQGQVSTPGAQLQTGLDAYRKAQQATGAAQGMPILEV